jgi:anti-sigma regulatory factor (Ser/Thr protein kinase)
VEQLEAEFDCIPSSVREARALLGRLSPPLQGAPAEVASLILSELVSNAVRHGCASPDRGILVRLSRDSSRMKIEVDQSGPLFDPEVVRRKEPGKDRGWGILLVQRLCSSWGVTPQGVWAAIQLDD